jgi:hypothetical protein
MLNVNYNIYTTTPGINANPSINEGDFIGDFHQPCAPQHQTYTGQLAILFNHIRSEANTTAVLEYDDIDTMTTTLQHLHMSELLHHDEDAIDPDGPNDIDVSKMDTNGCTNNDFTIGGFPALQLRLREILHEFNNIFIYNVKEKAMAVPP